MASNEVSIKVSTDSRKAAQDFDKLRGSIKLLDQEARRLGTGFTAGASQAETAMTRLQTRIARLRTEIQHTQAASRNLGGGGRGSFGSGGAGQLLSGIGQSLPGGAALAGGLSGVGGAVGAAAVYGGYLGYQEAREQSRAQQFLASAAKQTGQAFAAQAAEAAKLRRELGLTTAQSNELQAASLRFVSTIGKPGEAGKLSRALANALAASGRSPDEMQDRIRQLSTGQDELFDVLGPVKIGKQFAGSPSAIYKAYAEEILHVKRELTDLEKTQARYYAVLEAGAAAEGAASARMETRIGQIDRLTNTYKDLAGAIVTAALESEKGKGILGKLQDYADQSLEIVNDPSIIGRRVGSLPGRAASAVDDWIYGPKPQGLGNLGRSVLEQARGVGRMFGIGVETDPADVIARANRLINPGRTGLDNPFRLSFDPFGGKALADQNREAQYKFGMAGFRNAVPGIAAGFASPFSGIVSAGDRLAGLSIGGETAQARAARIFSVAGSVQTAAAEAYRIGGYSAGEAASMAESEARRFRIASLGNVGPGELTADQEAAYREDLKQFQMDQLNEVRKQLIELTKSRKALEKLAAKLAPDEFIEPAPITIQLDNRADVVAQFALIASGDSLRSDR